MSGVLSDKLENSVDSTRGRPLAPRVLARKDELEDALAELGPHEVVERQAIETSRIPRKSSHATSTNGSSATNTSVKT
jgi:hypothetical protein